MTICNACRYCEGLVRGVSGDGDAPHLRRRRSQLSRQSLPPLRRLLLRLPVFAAARVRRQRAGGARQAAQRQLRDYAWPRVLGALFAPTACWSPCSPRSASPAFIVGFVAWRDPAALLGAQCRRFLQGDAARRDGRRCSAASRSTRSRRSRSACARSGATSRGDDAAGGAAARRRRSTPRTLRYLGGGGGGCTSENEQPSAAAARLSPPDLLRLPAVLCRDLRRHALSLCLRLARALCLCPALPVCSARSAASGCSSGRSGCYALQRRARSSPHATCRAAAWIRAFIAMLFLTSLTGLLLLVLRDTRRDGRLARASISASCWGCFSSMPTASSSTASIAPGAASNTRASGARGTILDSIRAPRSPAPRSGTASCTSRSIISSVLGG